VIVRVIEFEHRHHYQNFIPIWRSQ
jgi:hypothetical protein